MADGDSSQDQEFSELLGFLQDQKPEVRRFAAEGVLGQTEDTDFLDYCRRNPRTAARPLLRLAEKAESEVSEAEAGRRPEALRLRRQRPSRLPAAWKPVCRL